MLVYMLVSMISLVVEVLAVVLDLMFPFNLVFAVVLDLVSAFDLVLELVLEHMFP